MVTQHNRDLNGDGLADEETTTVILAGGGGGAGASHYCCGNGGGGGGYSGEPGRSPSLQTSERQPRSNVKDLRDSIDSAAYHQNVDVGNSPGGDYSAFATGGLGGTSSEGGRAGSSASYQYFVDGKFFDMAANDPSFRTTEVLAAMRDPTAGGSATPTTRLASNASHGLAIHGGTGASGKEAGGGGGGGRFGGGGGGSGIDGGGGGGGEFGWVE